MSQASKFTAVLAGVLLGLFSSQFEAQDTVSGKWVWAGNRGWQRITLDLKASGNRLSGSISLGPGSKASNADDWEYFFEPAVFPITSGVIAGNNITFEQAASRTASQARGIPPGPGGREGGRDTVKYYGQIQGNSIALTRDEPARLSDPFSLGTRRFRFVVHRAGSTPSPGTSDIRIETPSPASPLPVSLDVEVMDTAGAAVLSLTKDDFVVQEDGAVRPIVNVVPPNASVHVMLMFDHNLTWLKDPDSLKNVNIQGAWERLFQSSLVFLSRLRLQDRFSIGVFEDTARSALDWRGVQNGRVTAQLGDVVQPPRGQKDIYGMIQWALTRFAGQNGRKSLIVFTDGRDGRLSPGWFTDSRQREVIDPLFGLVNDGEAQEFAETLYSLKQSGVKLHFIVINSDHDPEFGPAVVPRRISGLYPGATAGIRDYLSGVRSRLKQLAEISGGRVLYGNTPQDASLLFSDLHQELGVGKIYTLEFQSTQPSDGAFHRIEAGVLNKAFRVTQYRDGYIAH
ncbi:MAG TPA: hypothetical protein VFE29_08565 [Terriglobia bacterium]|nr:hypothetical protein [Terriglobia bacterium]